MASKYRVGDIIQSFDELERQENIMFHCKTLNRAIWQNWQYRFLKTQLDGGSLRLAINKNKYDYVKGYKAPLNSLPKDIKPIVEKKISRYGAMEDLDNTIFEVDVYYSVDIRNFYIRGD